MNQAFRKFLTLSEQERKDVFEAEAEELDTLPTYIEKDFWVCLVLDILYNGLPSAYPRLLFKGGTSLSKGYQLINRFSEDVDFTVFRDDIGFSGNRDPASLEISGKQRRKLSGELQETASKYICGDLRENLEATARNISSHCGVVVDPDDQDKSTLLFQYPSLFDQDNAAYVQPRVKLEGGGRSALDPHQECTIQPFITDVLNTWDFSVANIMTIAPERTFWDKVMILHGWNCGHRDEKRIPDDRQRLSRHYYDVARIANTGIGQSAVGNAQLREDVRQHTEMLFGAAWRKLEEAIPGSMRLAPQGELRTVLKKDYQAMQGMMLGEAPDFDEIIGTIQSLESKINSQI